MENYDYAKAITSNINNEAIKITIQIPVTGVYYYPYTFYV